MHLSKHQDISLGQKIVHIHHLEKHLMGQVVYIFWAKKNTNYFVTVKSDFVFSSIVTTNIQKTLQPVNTGAEHTYIISKHYLWPLCWSTSLIDNVNVLHCKNHLYLALVLNYFSHLALLMCRVEKNFLYLALVLNYDINWQCGYAALQNISYIWRLCWTTFWINNVNVLNCIKPIIFGACIELRLSFDTSNVLHCKNPLIFGACVQFRLSFRTADVLHAENLLYLSLVLNLVFDSALPMNCIAKDLLYLALVVNCHFCLTLPMCCIAKKFYIWSLFVLNYVFPSVPLMSCVAKHLLYLVLCVQSLLSCATFNVVLWKTSYVWRLFCNTSFICHFPCADW